jgi:hypothetical protein
MATITPFDYHVDEANHGDYQYTSLKEIVDGFELQSQDDDSILKNTKRYLILKYAKDAIKKLNKQVFKDILAMEITVPDDLTFALPHDFVDYVRVSVVVTDESTNSFRLQPLDINNRINTADGYLQDNDAAILFDQAGYILKADSSNAYNFPYKTYEFNTYSCNGYNYLGGRSNSPVLDTTKLSRWGEFKIDERRGKIVFSSDLADKEIVMEYVSDGVSFDTYAEFDISVHKDAVEAVTDWMYYLCIRYKKTVARADKNAALQRFKTTRHEAKLDRSGFDLLDVERKLRLSSKNL